jgi:hypothetical protein
MPTPPTRTTLAEALVVLASAAGYLGAAARTLLGGDNGELATVGWVGGVAHPPGMPVYVLYLRAMRWLPAASPVHATALATALLGVLAIVLMQRAARAWGASAPAAAIASAAYAFGPLAWLLATQAEAFTLNVVFALAIALVAAPSTLVRRPATKIAVLGLLAGLGLGNHQSIVLLAPLGLAAAICAARRAPRPWLAIGGGLATLALGLSSYAYVYWEALHATAATKPLWGDPTTLAGLMRHVLRSDYGTFELGVVDGTRHPLTNLRVLGESLLVGTLGGVLLLPVAPLVAYRRGGRSRPSGLAIAFGAALLLAGPLFVTRFNLTPVGVSRAVVERFHLLPLALVAIPIARALDVLAPALAARARLGAAIAAAVAIAATTLSLEALRHEHRPAVETWMRDALAILPANAIVVGGGDHRHGAFAYARFALGVRTDVSFVDAGLLLTTWYPPQAEAMLGTPIERARRVPGRGDRTVLDTPALLERLLATGRPVFITDWFAKGLDRSVPSYPIGPLIRIVDRVDALPPPRALYAMNLELEPRLTPPDPFVDVESSWAGTLADDYARPWLTLAEVFERAGDATRAADCRARARARAPWTATTH